MAQLLLDGEVDNRGAIIEALKEENRRLLAENSALNGKVRQLASENSRAVAEVRRQLAPVYRAFQMLFGEMDKMAIPDKDEPVAASPKNSAVWNNWKSRVGATGAKIIDALLTHSDANTQQLSILTGLHRTTIPAGIYALNKAGLINKSGGRFSLKEL